jgi:hypothetical protein
VMGLEPTHESGDPVRASPSIASRAARSSSRGRR